MGGVNSAPRFVALVGIGNAGSTATDATHQGGLVSIYCLGCIFGCFAGGWIADRIGRINGLFIGSLFALVGGALPAAITNSDFMLVARVITGIDTGALTGITPVLVSETSSTGHRGGFLGYVFIANYLGISIAYWLSFGLAFIQGGYSDFRWRFLLAFQCIPALFIALFVKNLPDSPRYLASVGRDEEARELLVLIRGGKSSSEAVQEEYQEILVASQNTKPSSPIQFAKILLGKGGKPGANLSRRAGLCIFLQIMASWTGITAITAYSPILLSQAGYMDITQNRLAGGLNTVGILGTIISAQIVDRLGRRRCLMLGSAVLFLLNWLLGRCMKALVAILKKQLSTPLSLFQCFSCSTWVRYAATWGTVAFLLPTEIFLSELRAQGNGFGITGWAIGVGMTTLVNPIMFDSIQSRSYFLLAGLNLLWIPIIYLFYPETHDRSLESIEALFSTSNPFSWDMERAYQHRGNLLDKQSTTITSGEDINESTLVRLFSRDLPLDGEGK